MSGLGAELQKTSKHHRAHHHHPHLHRRDKEEKVEKSLGPNLQQSKTFEGTKSEGVTPSVSRSGSRTTSVVASADDGHGASGLQRERRPVREGEVKAERERDTLRAAELRKSLTDLNALSNNTTRRLDNTYYSILEKLSALHNTIESLKELAVMTKKLNDEFTKESREVVTDIETQLHGFEKFEGQERKIGKLECRIETGRKKAQFLGERVEVVKQKIERWERVEGEWQQRTRKRLKILWAVMAITLLILVGLMVLQYTPSRTQGSEVLRGFNVSNLNINQPEPEERLGNETLRLKRSAVYALETLRRVPEEGLEDDPRLRAFDEL